MKLRQIAKIIGGNLLYEDCEIKAIATDSRTVTPGSLFFALKGKNFDGHNFINDASKNGAVACVTDKPIPLPCIVVKDTLKAFCDLAQAYRMSLDARVIAVTGSNGKTTTKDMIAHILGTDTVKAKNSYNNFVGLPLTILSATYETRHLVLELGSNAMGEIARLAEIAYPDIACITSIGPSHLEGFGSIQNIVQEKYSLLNYLKGAGFAVINNDSPKPEKLPARKIVTVSLSKGADLHPSWIEKKPGKISFGVKGVHFTLYMYGTWNITNALVSTAVCTGLGLRLKDCAERLETFNTVPMRMQKSEIDGVVFYNDAYNSNPVSACNALIEFESIPSNGTKTVIFGDMAELGQETVKYHENIATIINGLPSITTVILVGTHVNSIANLIKDKKVSIFENIEDAKETFWGIVKKGDSVLLKGSRVMQIESILIKDVELAKVNIE